MRCLLILALFVLAGCKTYPQQNPKLVKQRDRLFGDALHMKAVRKPDYAVAYRVTDLDTQVIRDSIAKGENPADIFKDNKKFIQEYPILSGPIHIPKKVQKQLSKLLLSPNSYLPRIPTLCGFSPGIAFRFKRGDVSVDVLLCFHCWEAMIVTDNPGEIAGLGSNTSEIVRLIDSFLPKINH